MNIIFIFIILQTFGNISASTSEIKEKYFEKYNRLNSETEKSARISYDKKRKPERILRIEKEDIECPDIEAISPCYCYIELDYGVVMDCSNVTTELELQTIFAKPFPQNDMYEFTMDQYYINSSIDDLPPGVFGSKTFESVYLRYINFNFSFVTLDHMNATLQNILVDSAPMYKLNHNFNAYTVLYDISLSRCPLPDILISSPTLEILTIFNTDITEIANNTSYLLGEMPNLRELEIGHNTDLYMMPDTSGYDKLERCGIYDSPISSIDVSERTENYLDLFDAGNNDLEDIPFDSIRMSENSTLFLYDNQIQYLEEEIWRYIFLNASVIWLQANPLDCSCVIAWILFGDDDNGTPFMEKMSGLEKCDRGNVYLVDLDLSDYINCTMS